jgi:hypothetical protein
MINLTRLWWFPQNVVPTVLMALSVLGSVSVGRDVSCVTFRRLPATDLGRFSNLRLRGAGDQSGSEANTLKELGNAAYKEKNFEKALEFYEKVFCSEIC